jgi:hypothetical protein
MDAAASDDTPQGNSPEAPSFPVGKGEWQNESSNHTVAASSPNSHEDEYEVKTGEESTDTSISAKSGEMRDFGEKARENKADDRENDNMTQRGNAGESGGEITHPLATSQGPSHEPEPRLEANMRRLEELKQESIRRKMEAAKKDEALSYPASASGQGGMPEASEDALLSRCCEELSKRSQDITSFKLADLTRAAGSPIAIERCKAWLMNRASPQQDHHRDCGSCSVALKGDRSAIKCDPCCYLRPEDSGDVPA